MNPEEQQLYDLIIRMTEWEEIPLETRRDFLAHILEINTLDVKAINFISQQLNKVATQETQRLNELKAELAGYEASLKAEQNTETSWKHRIYQAATKRIQRLSDNFKTGYRSAEATWNQTEEEHEKLDNQAQIVALKANL